MRVWRMPMIRTSRVKCSCSTSPVLISQQAVLFMVAQALSMLIALVKVACICAVNITSNR